VYGKLTGDGTGAFAGSVSSALRERIRNDASGFSFNVPQVLAWRPDLQLSLLEAIPGEPLMADAVKARLRDKPIAAGVLSLEEMIDACAQIAATLHTSGIPLGQPRSLDDELASLRQGISHVQRISPDLGARLEAQLDGLASYASHSDPLPACFNHGDFTHGQLLFDGTTSGLVDFDSVCQAEPALDLGQFLTYLRITSLKSKLTPSATRAIVEQLSDQFLGTYRAAAGDLAGDPAHLQSRVTVYKAISLLRRALRSWQKFKPSRIEGALIVLEEEITALSTGSAAAMV
jgi:aminoglycoside phosphotransferase (APT) family kinase protein